MMESGLSPVDIIEQQKATDEPAARFMPNLVDEYETTYWTLFNGLPCSACKWIGFNTGTILNAVGKHSSLYPIKIAEGVYER
jgi:hypothetical protein